MVMFSSYEEFQELLPIILAHQKLQKKSQQATTDEMIAKEEMAVSVHYWQEAVSNVVPIVTLVTLT